MEPSDLADRLAPYEATRVPRPSRSGLSWTTAPAVIDVTDKTVNETEPEPHPAR
jgi:hypothetical protein